MQLMELLYRSWRLISSFFHNPALDNELLEFLHRTVVSGRNILKAALKSLKEVKRAGALSIPVEASSCREGSPDMSCELLAEEQKEGTCCCS